MPAVAVAASDNDGNPPANAIDGSFLTCWSCNGFSSWITAGLGTGKPPFALRAPDRQRPPHPSSMAGVAELEVVGVTTCPTADPGNGDLGDRA